MMKKYLAIDIGASSGRHIVGWEEKGEIKTEEVFRFPNGVGLLPCMVGGTNEIGEATAEKMKKYRLVVWTNHGIYGTGKTMDEAFGLVETVEKMAQIYMLTRGQVCNEIPDEVVIGHAKRWNVNMIDGII